MGREEPPADPYLADRSPWCWCTVAAVTVATADWAHDDLGHLIIWAVIVAGFPGVVGVGVHPAGQGSGATGPKASRVAVLVLGIGGAMVLFIALWRVEIEQSFEVRPADKVTCKSPCARISTPFICDFVLGRLR